MGPGEIARTERLLVREWRDGDRVAFARMNADPAVMRYFPAPLTPSESDKAIERYRTLERDVGYCPWAVEEIASGEFVGFVGLHPVAPIMPFAPSVEIGWRLREEFWHRGYATEAARAVVDYARRALRLERLVSFTSAVNAPSRAVMERLGMVRDPDEDFEHPRVPPGHPLRPHVLYRRELVGPVDDSDAR